MSELQQEAIEQESRKPADGGGKVRLATLDSLDQRTLAAKRVSAMIADIEDDLGGSEHLSVVARQAVRTIAVCGAMIEDLAARWARGEAFDLAAYITLANTQRRYLMTIGLERRAKATVLTPAQYLAGKAPVPAPQATRRPSADDDDSEAA